MNIRIGLRSSALSKAQTNLVVRKLCEREPQLTVELCYVKTTGDAKQGLSGEVVRDKRDWIHELEEAVVRGEIDLAIHSAKDVPVEVSSATTVLPVLPRADARDVLIFSSKQHKDFFDLPEGASIGTASQRRRSQLLALRPDLTIEELRGNVTTRLKKLENQGSLDGIVLAAAGLDRLGLAVDHYPVGGVYHFSTKQMIPAVCQGMLAAHCLTSRKDLLALLSTVSESSSQALFIAEREVISVLGADCSSAVGVFAHYAVDNSKSSLVLEARVLGRNGARQIVGKRVGDPACASELGNTLGKELLKQGAAELLA